MLRKPGSSSEDVFYLYTTVEEAVANESLLKNRGLKFVRFEAQSVFFDVPVALLCDSKVISRSFTESRVLLALTEYSTPVPVLNEHPIKVPFLAEELEKFFFAVAFLNKHRDLEAFASSALCTIMKVADYFECPAVLRAVIRNINKRLAGKSPPEICDTFDIRSDITLSQRHQMEVEGLWSFNCTS